MALVKVIYLIEILAVCIALGETQVISETKKALKNAGVNVVSLEELANSKVNDGLKRSNHVLLVKNLPYGSAENELAKMFGKFGSLDNIILPPTKTLALIKSLRLPMRFGRHRGFAFVEYATQQEAQKALTTLSETHLLGRHMVIERAKGGESLDELRARTAAQFMGFKMLLSYPRKGST